MSTSNTALRLGIKRTAFWLVVATAYAFLGHYLIGYVFPIYVDGGGPSTGFYWGRRLTPTLKEWNTNSDVRAAMEFPYIAAAFVVTFIGCGLTAWLIRYCKPDRIRFFLYAASLTPLLILSLIALLDTPLALQLVTLMGYAVLGWALNHWKTSRRRLFLSASSLAFLLILLAVAASDAGTALKLWSGPTMYSNSGAVRAYLQVIVPMSLLAGGVAVLQDSVKGFIS